VQGRAGASQSWRAGRAGQTTVCGAVPRTNSTLAPPTAVLYPESVARKLIDPGMPVKCWCQQPLMSAFVSVGKEADPAVVKIGSHNEPETLTTVMSGARTAK